MTEHFLLLIILASSTGLLAGFLAGLFGVGGGVVVVPALYYLFQALGAEPDIAMAMAVATSLMCIVPTALSSIKAHHKHGNIDWTALRGWWLFLFLGAACGAVAVSHIDGTWLRLVFGLLLLAVAIITWLKTWWPSFIDYGKPQEERNLDKRSLGIRFTLFVIALISALAGVGGGALGGPLLIARGYLAHRAVGTAAAFGFLIATPAVIVILVFSPTPITAPYGSYALINFPVFFLIAFFSVLTAPLGAKVNSLLSHRILASILAVTLFLLSLKMCVSAFAH